VVRYIYQLYSKIDFGDAKCIDELEEEEKGSGGAMVEVKYESDHMERRGTFVGTMNYLAPEMITSNSASMATDIWALGCMIFKLITGNVPFTGTIGPQVY
jgi:serine/threonine protein kinase